MEWYILQEYIQVFHLKTYYPNIQFKNTYVHKNTFVLHIWTQITKRIYEKKVIYEKDIRNTTV